MLKFKFMKVILIHILFNQIPITEIISPLFCQEEMIACICFKISSCIDFGLEYRWSDESFSIQFFNDRK